MVLLVSTDIRNRHPILEFSVCEIIKLGTDSIMLVWFVMEFRVLKHLMQSYLAFTQKKNKTLNNEEAQRQLRRQNIFVRVPCVSDPLLSWT
jgi:hypothetical protein